MALPTRPPAARPGARRPLRPAPPADPAGEGLTVQETAARTGLSEHNLRYYERAGLLRAVRRDGSSGHRRYSADDVARARTLACLRAAGLPLREMRRYFVLAARGRGAAREVRALLARQADALEERMRAMQDHADYVRRKIDYWTALEAGQTAEAERIALELAAHSYPTTCTGDAS